MIMLKDNHIAICGSISKSIAKVRAVRDFASKIEVECSSQAEAVEALAAGVDIVMLDNFQPAVSHPSSGTCLNFSFALGTEKGGAGSERKEQAGAGGSQWRHY